MFRPSLLSSRYVCHRCLKYKFSDHSCSHSITRSEIGFARGSVQAMIKVRPTRPYAKILSRTFRLTSTPPPLTHLAEHNISTFMLEMKETAFICSNAGPKSLILIDELGRATSNEDGVAIAWSVSEFLLAKRSMTFFVTHYPQLAKLSEVYSGVQNQHMGASIDRGTNGEVLYFHKIMPGACSASSDYGVEMSASCGWPDDVVELVGDSPPRR